MPIVLHLYASTFDISSLPTKWTIVTHKRSIINVHIDILEKFSICLEYQIVIVLNVKWMYRA